MPREPSQSASLPSEQAPVKNATIPRSTTQAKIVCEGAERREKQYDLKDEEVPGLSLRVSATKKMWSLRYRPSDGAGGFTNRRCNLGEFPALSVAEARKVARTKKTHITAGGDPVAEKRAEKVKARLAADAAAKEIASRVYVKNAYQQWITSDKPSNRKGLDELVRKFDKDVLPFIGDMQIGSVTQRDIIGITDRIVGRGKSVMARQVFADIKQFFAWAVIRQLVTANPAEHIAKKDIGIPGKTRDRVLPPHEIRELDQKLHASSLNRVTHIIYMLQIAFTCRINELQGASWGEFDFAKQIWTIPAERSKSGRSIEVYMSPYTIGLLEELRALTGFSEWIYPGKTGERPINRRQSTRHASDRQKGTGVEPALNHTVQTDSLLVGNSQWKTHDLRRSGATLMQRLGIPSEISDRCLNHAEGKGVKGIYHRYEFTREMRTAWLKLSQALTVITGPEGDAFLKELVEDDVKDDEHHEGILAIVTRYHQRHIQPVNANPSLIAP